MKRIGIVGLGDMGIGMAKNVLQSGRELVGYDLRTERVEMLEALGGTAAASVQEVGQGSDAVFVMVLNGAQVEEVITGPDGLLESMTPGSTILITATIAPQEVRSIAPAVNSAGIGLMDAPVSGGKSGAEAGTLTMMVATPKEIFDANQNVLTAVGEQIFHVGEEPGLGQTVKAALQAFIGTSLAAVFESLALGAAAGVPGKTLYEVFGASGVSSPLFKNCAKLIMDRAFVGTGSHIGTMYKDLGISMGMAKEAGAAMFTTAAAYELFRAGISRFPEEDNWSCVKLLERITGTEVTW